MDPIFDVYHRHMEKLVAALPVNKEMVRCAFLDRKSADRICHTLSIKTKQTAEDGAYHNAISGFALPFESPSFCIVEVGCCRSVQAFSEYWAERNFDSYQDYVHGILYVDGKGFDLFQMMTGESLPATPTRDTVSRFLIGHVLRTEKENMLFTSVCWKPAISQYGIELFAPELFGDKTHTPLQTVRHFVLTREEVEGGAIERFLLGIGREAEAKGGISKIQGKIAFSISGYETDQRELWEIPEVKAYFVELDRTAPFFLYYIANEAHAPMVRVFLKMFVPPLYFEQVKVPNEIRDTTMTFIMSRLNKVMEYCEKVSAADGLPIDPDETAYHVMRCSGINVSREDVKKMHT